MQYVGLHSQIRKNNTRSLVQLIMFPLIIVGLTWLFFIALKYLTTSEDGSSSMSWDQVNDSFISVIPWILAGCVAWFLIAYASHSQMIKSATHSQTLSRKDNKRVYNLVENLCMANGMKMPMLNVIEDSSLNAFASGINDKTFTVTLTRGIIDKLDDDELEGVIAHELSHIRNRDVRLLIVSIIFVGIFAFLSQMALQTLKFSAIAGRSNNDKKGGAAVVMLVIVALAFIGYLVSLFLRFGISRNREYMADARAAQMTKKPQALASALRKISTDNKIEVIKREDIAQLYIEHSSKAKGDGFSLSSMFATHPPIKKRIQVLEQF